mmetsp:Transcript_65877/g.208495  ORF Transcript_65877/g.208495 Transcript_65877/m.208495 type:complete len:204 (+) Transcript_65877:390-1001(+)
MRCMPTAVAAHDRATEPVLPGISGVTRTTLRSGRWLRPPGASMPVLSRVQPSAAPLTISFFFPIVQVVVRSVCPLVVARLAGLGRKFLKTRGRNPLPSLTGERRAPTKGQIERRAAASRGGAGELCVRAERVVTEAEAVDARDEMGAEGGILPYLAPAVAVHRRSAATMPRGERPVVRRPGATCAADGPPPTGSHFGRLSTEP